MRAPGEGLGERYLDEIDGMTSSSAAMRTQTKIPKKADEIGALGIDTDDLL
jgi:HAMP domain-containing protein